MSLGRPCRRREGPKLRRPQPRPEPGPADPVLNSPLCRFLELRLDPELLGLMPFARRAEKGRHDNERSQKREEERQGQELADTRRSGMVGKAEAPEGHSGGERTEKDCARQA